VFCEAESKVTCSAAEIEEVTCVLEDDKCDGGLSPVEIEAEAEKMVCQVVSSGDSIE